jgi:hypothetical protein
VAFSQVTSIMSDTFELLEPLPSPDVAEAITGLALAEAVVTCRVLEDRVENLQSVVRNLTYVISELQSRVEFLEPLAGSSKTVTPDT